ncbi:hypothetical protein UT4_16130 [Ferrigenium sp. UT4]
MTKEKKNEKLDVSKRMFFRSAVAVVGAVTTAGVAKTVATASADSANQSNKRKYAQEALRQERIMLQKKFVLMTDDEKKLMLDEILGNHHKQTA